MVAFVELLYLHPFIDAVYNKKYADCLLLFFSPSYTKICKTFNVEPDEPTPNKSFILIKLGQIRVNYIYWYKEANGQPSLT